MDDFDFSEEEIKEQLEVLGYRNVPTERLKEFKIDLEQLVKSERSKNSSLFSTTEQSSSDSEAKRESDVITGTVFGPVNHREIRNGGKSTSVEHAKYGKENMYSTQPQSIGGAVYRLPIQHDKQDGGTRQEGFVLYGNSRARSRSNNIHDPDTLTTDETLDTTSCSDHRIIKRKVLRKRDGERQIYDESVTESETDVSSLEERLRNLPLCLERPTTAPAERGRHRDAVPDRPESARNAPVYRLPEDYEGCKALIRPMSVEPHKQNVRKNDPVARYQQYRNSWQCHRAPGEKQHKGLRWSVREHMMHHDEVVHKKPSKVYVPNSYQIPSDKKRKNLRWQIRNDMATGVVPPSMFD